MLTWKHSLACVALALLAGAPVAAKDYPDRPVKMIVPYPPGGPTDIVARVVSQKLSEQTGQPFVIDNRPGGGANIGAEAVARAPADGYTLLVATTAHAINHSLVATLSYDIMKDFVPVSSLSHGPLMIVANPSLPAQNVLELIELAKSKPGELTFGSTGNGGSPHLAAEMFSWMAGIKMTHVPYKGSAPALTDLMGGQVSLMFDTMLSAMPHVKSGKLKALAVTSAARSSAAPELPTVAESGLAGFEAISWYGLLGPAGTPPDVSSKLSAELKKTLELAEVRAKFEAQGFAAVWSSPEAFADFLQAEVKKWAKVVQTSGATVD